MTPLPYLTAYVPGTGGALRSEDDDFVVEELPAYGPSGAGDHLHLQIEKRGIGTLDAVEGLARALGRAPRDIGYAGMKDKHAVAVQTLSVEHVTEPDAERAVALVPGLKLLSAGRHGNKLKLGHLRGNAFTIRVRGVADDAADVAREVLDVLSARGCPNWFGEQRFGIRADNDAVGRALVRGDLDGAFDRILTPGPDSGETDPRAIEARRRYESGDLAGARDAFPPALRTERRLVEGLVRGKSKATAVGELPRPLLRLYASAYQSALFNRLVAARMPELGTLVPGDLAFLHDRGAVFRVEDAASEQARADRFEISPTAPLFGTRTLLADGAPGDAERALLASEELTPASFRVRGAGEMDGERRPIRVPVADAVAEILSDDPAAHGAKRSSLLVRFSLPRGCYATAVLREIMKNG